VPQLCWEETGVDRGSRVDGPGLAMYILHFQHCVLTFGELHSKIRLILWGSTSSRDSVLSQWLIGD
jgi:hypothetical protein